jgi:hypothetical protein
MKKLMPLLAVLAFGAAAAPASGVFLVGFPKQEFESVEVVDFEVLGGFDQTWQTGLKATVSNGTRYNLWGLSGKLSATSVGSAKESYGAPCEETYGVKMKPDQSRKNWVIASNAAWNLRPRVVAILPNNNAFYGGVVSDYLKSKGIKSPQVNITALVRTDLDGDKQDEIIIAASRGERAGLFPTIRAGLNDYSLLLVRKIIDGKVQTIALGEDVQLKATTDEDINNGTYSLPDVWDLVNVLDLNGDGKLEVIFFNAIYEDYGVFALEWTGKKFEQRLVSGCGA